MDTRDIVEQLQDACDLATDKRELERLCGNAKIEIVRLREGQKVAGAAVEETCHEATYLRELLAWSYAKLHYRPFGHPDDALMLDRVKLFLEHGIAG